MLKTSFQVAATYVGAVMGAGFASGQEIQQFFVRFGAWGLIGICLSSLLFAWLGWIMLDLQERRQVSTYPEFFRNLFGKSLGKAADILVSILLFLGMLAMLSGSGALFSEYFGFSRWLGISLTAVVIGLALWYRGEGVLWINSVLIPLKFAFCLGIAALAFFWAKSGDGEGIPLESSVLLGHWAAAAVLYVSFNLTLAMVVFASLGKTIQKPGARLGAVAGGLALGMFATVIAAALLRFPEVSGLEIPMVAVAAKLGAWPAFLYVVVLWMAMLTAAIGNGFSLVSRIVDSGFASYQRAAFLLLVAVVPLAGVRFSQLVKIGYPIFGYIGLAFLPVLILHWHRT